MSGRPKRNRGQTRTGGEGSPAATGGDTFRVDATGDRDDGDAEAAAIRRKRKRPRRTNDDSSASAAAASETESGNDRPSSSSDPPPPLLNSHPHARLPSYLSEAFSDLHAEDGLAVLGRGMGWLALLSSFVRYYADLAEYDPESDGDGSGGETGEDRPRPRRRRRKPPLVFVLNLRDDERRTLLSTLTSWGTPPSMLPGVITNESGQANERAALYARGGTYVVTSRILIVDLLAGTANANDVAGMLVAHAEAVRGETSTEAFILRIFRSQKRRYVVGGGCGTDADGNGGGFVKAFTDHPSALVSGFARADKVLRALRVRRMYLYPRFRASVAAELERRPPAVTELHQPLSDKMKEIQHNLAAATRACLRDLRGKCRAADFSFLFDAGSGGGEGRRGKRKRHDAVSEHGYGSKRRKGSGDPVEDWKFTIQQCVSTNFGYVLSRQLDGDWHRLGRDVKQSISDLKTLSQLFHYLIEYDCVQFWRLLQGVKAMSAQSRNPSYWMLQDAGENLFRLAKERVFRLVVVAPDRKQAGANKGDKGPNNVRLKQVLEEKPKEILLHQVLTEVENRWSTKVQKAREDKSDGSPSVASSANVLLMVKDERTLRSVHSYLLHGSGKRAMSHNFLKFLEQHVEKVKPMLRTGGHDNDSLPTEQRLLYEEHSRVKNYLFGNDARNRENQLLDHDREKLSDWKRKHRKVTEEKTRGMGMSGVDTIRQKADMEEAVEKSRVDAKISTTESMFQRIDVENESSDDCSENSLSSSDDEDKFSYKVAPIEGLSLFIRTFSQMGEGEASVLLHDIRPEYVVMYDSDPSFIRTLEIYSNHMVPHDDCEASPVSLAEEDRLQVFFLLYDSSAEDINFLKSLEREKEAFDKLIDHQKRMPTTLLPLNNFLTQEMQQAGGVGGSYADGTLPLSMDTRTGNQNSSKERRDIAVDVREFRSALPSILHQGGMRLAPVTLAVGDFILSNVHCVERKSISDLYGSFHSGRLYDQTEAMVKNYKCPCLLIEFDPDKNFALQNANELGGEIRDDAIGSKLVLLTMAFSKLRLLWSRSPHETLKLFKKLKRNHQEVDVDRAMEVGSNETLDELLLGDDGDEENAGTNDAAKNMLLRLPGVNAQNARKIMSECESIASLSRTSREELRRIAGPVAGQKLFTFFRQTNF